MRHITIGGHRTYDAEAVAFWVFAGVIMLIAFGDAMTVLAAVIAAAAAISWIYRRVGHGAERNDVEATPVTPLRLELTGRRDAIWTSVGPWRHGPRVA